MIKLIFSSINTFIFAIILTAQVNSAIEKEADTSFQIYLAKFQSSLAKTEVLFINCLKTMDMSDAWSDGKNALLRDIAAKRSLRNFRGTAYEYLHIPRFKLDELGIDILYNLYRTLNELNDPFKSQPDPTIVVDTEETRLRGSSGATLSVDDPSSDNIADSESDPLLKREEGLRQRLSATTR